MPQITVYLRNEDIDKWKSIEKKSEWLHNLLNAEAGASAPKIVRKIHGIEVNDSKRAKGLIIETNEVARVKRSEEPFKTYFKKG